MHAYASHLSIEQLSVSYGAHRALANVTVAIPDKKITVIIGPSGCGKSTLLRSCNRLLDYTESVHLSGRVVVDGENILEPTVDVTRIRKKMGLLSQRPCPLPMSIYDNVAYGPRLYGVHTRRVLDTIVEQYLRKAHLWNDVCHRLHAPATELSVGQQQRLSLARGLAVQPEIILGDEPTSALDPVSSQYIEQLFLELRNDYTIVLVTHILRQARRLADYVIFLYCGELIEHGPAEELFTHPRQKLTKEYIQGVIS